MAKIAIVSSSFAGAEHVYEASLVARALGSAGHDVACIVGDIGAIETLSSEAQITLRQEPPAVTEMRRPVSKSDKPEGFVAQLARAGYDDLETLRLLANEWTGALQSVQPDAIVALANPVVWLLGPMIAPTLALGRGRNLPPIGRQELASLPEELLPAVDSALLLGVANTVLSEMKAERLKDLSDLLWRCQQHRYGLDVLDPYARLRSVAGLGVLASQPVNFAPRDDRRLAVFLDAAYPGIEAVVLAMTGLGDLNLDVYIQDATPAMKGFLARLGQVTLYSSFAEMIVRARNAAAIVHHGVPLIAEQGILNGRPQLALPWTGEHHVTLAGLKALGVVWWKNPDCSIEEFGGTLRGVSYDVAIGFAANNVQRDLVAKGIDDALEPIINRVDEAIERARSRGEAMGSGMPQSGDFSSGIETAIGESRMLMALAPQPKQIASKVFCALPFKHLCVGNEGTARICCMSSDLVSENGNPISLYTRSAEEVWNSEYMREVRRKILADEPLTQCKSCYENEAATATSYRTHTGLYPFDSQLVDVEKLRREAIANDYRVKVLPQFIKLELGNLCNLRCRMCWGGNSSEIERDPVHSTWSGGADPLHAAWQGEYAIVGPDSRIGVKRGGVYGREPIGEHSVCWTDGAARFDIPLGTVNKPNQLIVDFDRNVPRLRVYRMRINGKLVHTPDQEEDRRSIFIDLDPQDLGSALTIDFESERVWNGQQQRWEGLPLNGIRLRRDAGGTDAEIPVVIKPRLSKPGLWYNDDGLIFDELLGDGSGLKRFYVTGGEPLLEPRFREIIDYLVTKGVAKNIDMELTTNATVFDEEIFDLLAQFKSLLLTISVDGVGAVQEYIRYPVRWSTVEKNIKKIRALNNVKFEICAIPVVQSYNMLDLANICEFAQEVGIYASVMNNLQDPGWLRTSVMPQNVHRVAAEKLRHMLGRGQNEYLRHQVETLIQHFQSFEAPVDHNMLAAFNLFTNDLDRSRDQSFRDSLPELFGLIEESGYRWSDETKHFGKVGERRTARERSHAWI